MYIVVKYHNILVMPKIYKRYRLMIYSKKKKANENPKIENKFLEV